MVLSNGPLGRPAGCRLASAIVAGRGDVCGCTAADLGPAAAWLAWHQYSAPCHAAPGPACKWAATSRRYSCCTASSAAVMAGSRPSTTSRGTQKLGQSLSAWASACGRRRRRQQGGGWWAAVFPACPLQLAQALHGAPIGAQASVPQAACRPAAWQSPERQPGRALAGHSEQSQRMLTSLEDVGCAQGGCAAVNHRKHYCCTAGTSWLFGPKMNAAAFKSLQLHSIPRSVLE